MKMSTGLHRSAKLPAVELNALLEQAKEAAELLAQDFSEPDDDWPPVAFFGKGEGIIGMGDLTWFSEEEKQRLIEDELPEEIANLKASSVALALSSWKHDGRGDGEELVIIAVNLIAISAVSAPIIREPIPRLGDWSTMGSASSPWIDSVRAGLSRRIFR